MTNDRRPCIMKSQSFGDRFKVDDEPDAYLNNVRPVSLEEIFTEGDRTSRPARLQVRTDGPLAPITEPREEDRGGGMISYDDIRQLQQYPSGPDSLILS